VPEGSRTQLTTAGRVIGVTPGAGDGMVTEYAEYTALGGSLTARCEAYRELFRVDLDAEVLGEIHDNLNRCRALGSERFKNAIEAALHRKVRPGKAGRPRKKTNITPYFYSLPSIRRARCSALNCRHRPGR
jgi:hypothetical protein